MKMKLYGFCRRYIFWITDSDVEQIVNKSMKPLISNFLVMCYFIFFSSACLPRQVFLHMQSLLFCRCRYESVIEITRTEAVQVSDEPNEMYRSLLYTAQNISCLVVFVCLFFVLAWISITYINYLKLKIVQILIHNSVRTTGTLKVAQWGAS